MNASYNDQLKQSNRAFSTCWDSDPLSNTWAYSKTGFKSSGRRHVLFQRFLKKSFAVLKQPIFLVNSTFTNQPRPWGQYQINWDPVYKSFVSVSHLPYHLCANRTFSISEENLLQSEWKTK